MGMRLPFQKNAQKDFLSKYIVGKGHFPRKKGHFPQPPFIFVRIFVRYLYKNQQ